MKMDWPKREESEPPSTATTGPVITASLNPKITSCTSRQISLLRSRERRFFRATVLSIVRQLWVAYILVSLLVLLGFTWSLAKYLPGQIVPSG